MFLCNFVKRWGWTAASLIASSAIGQSMGMGRLPDSLEQGAAVVKRMDLTEIDIESPRKARMHRKYIYTILNPAGEPFGTVFTFYDKFHDLGNVSATLYDARGNVVRKLKKSELEDWNIDGLGILMMDARVKYYRLSLRSYPYTISYEEDMTLDGLFGLEPQWLPQPMPMVSVVGSSLVVRAPADYPLQYKDYHFSDPVTVTEKKGIKTYSWQLANRPAVTQEPYAADWYSREPRVSLAPGDFEVQGLKGNCSSWTELGRFCGSLYQGRGQLPEEARRKVHALVDGLSDDRDKIKVLYGFLQQNTHYVGIELGIGGWQPYDASYVYSKKYGDCKALANYMVALLKEAGIRACPVLIRSGAEAPAIDTGFACIQFNHVIAVAFAGKDSVWLECTSSTLPPGYLSNFTADRDALLLDEQGGHIVHTPVYGIRENRLDRLLKGSIDDQGNLAATLRTDYSGLEQDVPESMINRLNKKDLQEQKRQQFGVPNCSISNLRDSATPGAIPSLEETMELSVDMFATMAGNRLLITPGVFMKRSPRLTESPNRKTPVELRTSVTESDSVVLRLPADWSPEGNLPAGNYSCALGSYHIRSSFEGGVLTLRCSFSQNKGIYPAQDYARLVRLFNLVHRESDRELVFVKATAKAGP
jgi:transglutaminase-like putative cysteine protease